MTSVKYQRFLPAATVAASVALLAGCVFAVSSGAGGTDSRSSLVSTATVQSSSPEAIASTLRSMKAKNPASQRYEIMTADKAITVSVFGADDADVERVQKFADVVTRHPGIIAEANLSEYDPDSHVENYEGSMFLKSHQDVSSEDAMQAVKEFAGFNANIHFSLRSHMAQIMSVPVEEMDTVLPLAEKISLTLQESAGKDTFSVSIRGDDRQVTVMRRVDSLSKDEFNDAFNALGESVTLPATWKIVSK